MVQRAKNNKLSSNSNSNSTLRNTQKEYAEFVEFILRPYQNNSIRWCDFSKSAFQWIQKQKSRPK